jgi:hypothetical protein
MATLSSGQVHRGTEGSNPFPSSGESCKPDLAATLVRYGMTVAQFADVYGVAVGEIKRILHKA